MNLLNLITDAYDRQARLYPSLLLIAPAAATLVALLWRHLSTIQSLGTLGFSLGGAFLLTQLARDSGKRKEKALFKRWGGSPSIAILRHSDDKLDRLTKVRYHKKLQKLVKGPKAPTEQLELTDPNGADAVYASWSNYLRVNTRDIKTFHLLFQENISYGYRRNLLGLRPFGISLSLANMAACFYWLFYRSSDPTTHVDLGVFGAISISTVMFLLWAFRFNTEWVRISADAYAARLVECVEQLDP